MSIELLDSCEIVIAFPDVCSKNYLLNRPSTFGTVHFWNRSLWNRPLLVLSTFEIVHFWYCPLLRPSTFTLTYNNFCDSPVSNDDSAWIWFTMSCRDNIFWWTNWTTAHMTSWDIWKISFPIGYRIEPITAWPQFDNLPKFPLLWDTCHGNSPISAWKFELESRVKIKGPISWKV